MNSQPTQKQIGLLHHTLGLCPERRESGRNHFVAGPGHHDMPDLERLVEAGLMKRAGTPTFLRSDDIVFCVTDTGYALAIDHLAPAPPPRKRSRYEEFLDADSGLTFAEWLGIEIPKVDVRLAPQGHEYRYTRRAYLSYLDVDVIEGDWKPTMKEAKASYKQALRRSRECAV